MFVLQECSICFEDFDNERGPYSVSCGHVFCRPCLESLASSSSSCPNCRTPFTSDSIRKVVCAQQVPEPAPSASQAESEAETLMWQAIQSAVETPNEYDQRKSLVRHNSDTQALRDAGMSANVLVALDVMQLLVKTEQWNRGLKDKVDTARAVEESLCDRISVLEAQLSAKTGHSGVNSHDFHVLASEVRALQSSIQLIKADTSSIAKHFSADPKSPLQLRVPAPTPTPIIPNVASDPPPTPTPTPSLRPARSAAVLRKPSPQNSPPTPSILVSDNARDKPSPPQYVRVQTPRQEYFSNHQRTLSTPGGSQSPRQPRQPLSPPATPAIQTGRPLFEPSSPMMKRDVVAPRGYGEGPLPTLPDPQSPRTPSNWVVFNGESSSSTTTNQPSSSKPQRTPPKAPPAPKPTPHTRTVTATHAFTGTSSTELTFAEGQLLFLFPESDLSQGKDWVWCRTEAGADGYAPRSYLRVGE